MFRAEYCSPLGRLTLVSDGKALWGLWIKGQKYFGASLSVADCAEIGRASCRERV